MRFGFGLVLMLVGASAWAQQSAATAVVTFTFEWAGIDVPKYSLTLGEDGRGHYSATEVGRRGVEYAPQTVESDVQISAARTAAVFAAARELKRFDFACASTLKGVASSGAKTLAYAGPDGAGKCAFDYADDKRVMMLTSFFLGVAMTLDEGRVLEFDRRFDPLGLDKEISVFTGLVKEGNALEVGNIAPVLRRIAGDSGVFERVRVKAADLLADKR